MKEVLACMIKLFKNGVYLLNGKDIIEDVPSLLSAPRQLPVRLL